MFGFYGLLLLLLGLACFLASVIRKQRFAPFIFSAGVLLLAVAVASVFFNFMPVFQWIGLNFYVAIIVAMILVLTGLIGSLVRCANLFSFWLARRRGGSLPIH